MKEIKHSFFFLFGGHQPGREDTKASEQNLINVSSALADHLFWRVTHDGDDCSETGIRTAAAEWE